MENIILLHGALGNETQMQGLAKTLSSSFNVYFFDFEGHGNNLGSRDFTMDVFSSNILDFMNMNELEKSHFFGYSMGGYAALYFAKHHEEKVGKIVCLGTKLKWNPEIAKNEIRSLDPEKIEEKVPKFAAMLHGNHQNWKQVVKKTADMMIGLGDNKGIAWTDFREIFMEVLLCIGENDKMVSLDETKAVADTLPNGAWRCVSNMPHAIEKVDSDTLANLIEEFIIQGKYLKL